MIDLEPTCHLERHHLHRVGIDELWLLALAEPPLGDGRDRACELTRRRLRPIAPRARRRSDPKRASARSRSTTSVCAANNCCRRRPSRSIRRCT